MNFYLKYVKYVSGKPLLIIVLVICVIIGGLPVLKTRIGNSPEDWNPKGSSQLTDKTEFIKHFGNDEIMTLYLTFPDSTPDDYRLTLLESLGDSIGKLYGFEQVFSRSHLSSIRKIIGKKNTEKLDKAYFNSLNPNGEILFLKLRVNSDPDKNRPFLLDSLTTITNQLPKTVKTDLTGPGVIFNEINRLSTSDSKYLLTTCFICVFFLLWWRLKKTSYLFICTAIVVLALWFAISLYDWLDISVNMITMIVPLLFIINFFSFTIHLITKQTVDIKKYLHKKMPPIIASALTNIIGFGSLMLSKIQVIYEFGLLTSLGIIAGLFVILLIGTPLIVRYIEVNERVEKQDWMNKLLDAYYKKLTPALSWFVVIIMTVWLVVGIIVFPYIKIDTNSIGFMKPDNKVRQSEEYIEKNHGSVTIIDFMIDKKNGLPFSKGDWKKISEIRQQLHTLPFIKSSYGYDLWQSLILHLKSGDSVLSAKLSANFLTLDKKHSRLAISVPSGSIKVMQEMLSKSQKEIEKKTEGTEFIIRPVGFLPIYIEQMTTIVDGMLENLFVAVILILIVMSLFVRNLKIGLITTVISVFPLCGVALLMKLLGIPFDIATSVISSVVVGMIADDALHIIWSFKDRIYLHRKIPSNLLFADSVRSIVHPCTATSIMFAIGFAVLLGSDIISIVDFGILSTAVIVFAWISDFIFFPALLRLVYSSTPK
ncbi:MAG TPA: MMPL family transporter [Bacteroidia bacterium]|jgi:predicted RND superfamily exporter protein|nr:MMPL family transporter [Bacteroidia bacterium]